MKIAVQLLRSKVEVNCDNSGDNLIKMHQLENCMRGNYIESISGIFDKMVYCFGIAYHNTDIEPTAACYYTSLLELY